MFYFFMCNLKWIQPIDRVCWINIEGTSAPKCWSLGWTFNFGWCCISVAIVLSFCLSRSTQCVWILMLWSPYRAIILSGQRHQSIILNLLPQHSTADWLNTSDYIFIVLKCPVTMCQLYSKCAPNPVKHENSSRELSF